MSVSVALVSLLAACGSTSTPIVEPPVYPDPSPSAISVTTIDATIDLTKGNNSNRFQSAAGTTYSLVKLNTTGDAKNLLAQATVGTNNHVSLTLPGATTMAPFLDQFSPTVANEAGAGCTVKSYSVKPATFSAAMAGHVLKIGDSSASYSGFLSLLSLTSDGQGGRILEYVDQDVTLTSDVDCVVSGREDRTVTNLKLLKGWNVVNISTTESGTDTAPIYTHAVQSETATSATAQLLLWTGSQTEAPRS